MSPQSGSAPYYCEMCGRPVYRPKYYEVDGVVMILCDKCAKFGKPVSIKKIQQRKEIVYKAKRKVDRILEEPSWDLVENFGIKIRDAREKKGWKQEDLARKIGEPVTFIRKLESGKIRPPDDVIEKLEKLLGIKIRKEIGVDEESIADELEELKSSGKITLGDVVIIKKKKKKK